MEGTNTMNTTVPVSYPEKKGKYMRLGLFYDQEHTDKAQRLVDLVTADEGMQRMMVETMRDRIGRCREKGEEISLLENYLYTHPDNLKFANGSVSEGRCLGEVLALLLFVYE